MSRASRASRGPGPSELPRALSTRHRRDLITRRHHLAGDGTSPEEITRALLALHATDPATIFVSVLVRGAGLGLPDVLDALYGRRTLVRWMAMRRTLFVLPRESVPMVQAAASTPLSVALRRQLIRQLELSGTEPAIEGDVGAWLSDVEAGVHRALRARGTATGVQLSADEPRLRTAILPRAGSDVPQNVTSRLLVLMGTDATMVRGTPNGSWTSRRHQWEPIEHWWPDGLPAQDTPAAQVELVRAWLTAFGPAPVRDLEWWTGWTKTAVRGALAQLPLVEIDLDGETGIALADGSLAEELARPAPEPVATLLPALDPTPMGWKRREWFFGIDQAEVFDRNGNIGPTLWWDGEIIGGWGVSRAGEVRTAILTDRGAEAAEAADRVAADLQTRLDGAVITPSFRTPVEKRLAG